MIQPARFSLLPRIMEAFDAVNNIGPGFSASAILAPVDALYDGYGEGAPRGKGPEQGRMQMIGNSYLRESFPKLDYIKSAKIIE